MWRRGSNLIFRLERLNSVVLKSVFASMSTGVMHVLFVRICLYLCVCACTYTYTTVCVVPKDAMERWTRRVGERRGEARSRGNQGLLLLTGLHLDGLGAALFVT